MAVGFVVDVAPVEGFVFVVAGNVIGNGAGAGEVVAVVETVAMT